VADLLAAIRTRVRLNLGDDASAIWSDAQLDRAIAGALDELGRVLPRERTAAVTLSATKTYALTTESPDPTRVVAVEWPTGEDPISLASYSIFAGVLTLLEDGAESDGVTLYIEQEHTLDGSSTTLSEQQEEVLVMGAMGYALRQQAVKAINVLTTGGANVDRDYRSLANDLLREFREALRLLRGVRRSKLYAPAEPVPSQSTDPGP